MPFYGENVPLFGHYPLPSNLSGVPAYGKVAPPLEWPFRTRLVQSCICPSCNAVAPPPLPSLYVLWCTLLYCFVPYWMHLVQPLRLLSCIGMSPPHMAVATLLSCCMAMVSPYMIMAPHLLYGHDAPFV